MRRKLIDMEKIKVIRTFSITKFLDDAINTLLEKKPHKYRDRSHIIEVAVRKLLSEEKIIKEEAFGS
ncbi:MAG: hypothetical protein QXO57_02585 [Candidatus Aenigmatarchaeota archaeon]